MNEQTIEPIVEPVLPLEQRVTDISPRVVGSVYSSGYDDTRVVVQKGTSPRDIYYILDALSYERSDRPRYDATRLYTSD